MIGRIIADHSKVHAAVNTFPTARLPRLIQGLQKSRIVGGVGSSHLTVRIVLTWRNRASSQCLTLVRGERKRVDIFINPAEPGCSFHQTK